MTVRDKIIESTINAVLDRLIKLREMSAPPVLTRGCEDELAKLDRGELKCKGDIDLLDEEFVSVEERVGRGRIKYYVFNGNINYFPKAKYGRFVAKGEVK